MEGMETPAAEGAAPEPEPTGAEQNAAEPQGTDWKAEARKWEARAKRADKAERDLAKATERAEAAERKLAAREAAEQHAELVRKVAEKHRVDPKYAALLTADDEEGLTAQAKLIGERFADPVLARLSGARPRTAFCPYNPLSRSKGRFGDYRRS